jgi:hypothetical protein
VIRTHIDGCADCDLLRCCAQQEAEFRPGMAQVAQDLRRALDDE